VPSEKVWSRRATRRMLTERALIFLSAFNLQAGLTDINGVQSLRLFDEAVDLVHLIDARHCPAFSFNDFFDFFSKRFHIVWMHGQVIEPMRESLPRFLKTGLGMVVKITCHQRCVDRCEIEPHNT